MSLVRVIFPIKGLTTFDVYPYNIFVGVCSYKAQTSDPAPEGRTQGERATSEALPILHGFKRLDVTRTGD